MRFLTPATVATLPLRASALAAALTASLATAGALAAEPAATRAESGFGTRKGTLLTKEELRKCLERQDSLKAQDADLLKEQAALAARNDEIQHIGEGLKARLEGVDRSNAEAVAAYNEAVLDRDKQIDDYQARVDKFNAGVDQNKAAHDQFGQACSNRRYLEEDEAALRKGK